MKKQLRTEIEFLVIQFYHQHELLRAISEELRERTSNTLIDFEQMCKELIKTQGMRSETQEYNSQIILVDHYNEEFHKQSGDWFLNIRDWQIQYQKLEDLRDEIGRYYKMIYDEPITERGDEEGELL